MAYIHLAQTSIFDFRHCLKFETPMPMFPLIRTNDEQSSASMSMLTEIKVSSVLSRRSIHNQLPKFIYSTLQLFEGSFLHSYMI